jgi:hypothetical protein
MALKSGIIPKMLTKEEKDELRKLTFENHHTRAFRAIRAKCLNCCAYIPKEVNQCVVVKCSLWPYRFGHRIKHKSKEVGLNVANEISQNPANPNTERDRKIIS